MIKFKNGIAYEKEKPIILHISNIEPLSNYRIRATFENGEIKTYDCAPLLDTEAFAPLKNEGEFKKVSLDYGVPTWEGANVDISPETIYLNGK